MRYEAVHGSTRGLGVSKVKNESSQGVLHQWFRVRTQSLDAGLCNKCCELDAGVEANIDDYYYYCIVVIIITTNICYQFGEGQFG